VQQLKRQNTSRAKNLLFLQAQGVTRFGGVKQAQNSGAIRATRATCRGRVWSEMEPRTYDSRLRGSDMFMIEGVLSVKCQVSSRRSERLGLPTSNFTLYTSDGLPAGLLVQTKPNLGRLGHLGDGTWGRGRAFCAKRGQISATPGGTGPEGRGAMGVVQTKPMCFGVRKTIAKAFGLDAATRRYSPKSCRCRGLARQTKPIRSRAMGRASALWKTIYDEFVLPMAAVKQSQKAVVGRQ